VVLTGQGHIFSAGVDLLQVSAGGADYLDRSAKSRTVFSALSGTHLLACRATC
jgi:enoyl-CoA hydratase/carnithine racemase